MRNGLKMLGLGFGSIATMLAPLGLYVGFNYDKFVSTTPQILSLTAFGSITVGLSVFAVLGKLNGLIKDNKSLTVFAVIFALCVILEPIIVNAKMVTGMILIGQLGDTVTFKHFIKKQREKTESAKQTEQITTAVAQAVETVINKSGGRV